MTIIHTLADGQMLIPTSFHGCRFNDGTEFKPTQEQIASIKGRFECLKIDRKFSEVGKTPKGKVISHSAQVLTPEAEECLKKTQAEFPQAIILVSFMILSALVESGRTKEFPLVVAANATPETSRSAPQDKIWDVNNWAQ